MTLKIAERADLSVREGRSLLKSHPKTKRTLLNKSHVHLVLRSNKATGDWSLLKYAREIEGIAHKVAAKHFIVIKRLANAGNHLHIVLWLQNQNKWATFIRELSHLVMKKVTGCKRGASILRSVRSQRDAKIITSKESVFWEGRPFTRLISMKKDILSTLRYLKLNSLEVATGLSRPAARRLLDKVMEKTEVGWSKALPFKNLIKA